MATEPTVIASRVIAARRRRALSREALAFHSGVSWSAIAQIETGRRPNPRADTLSALARSLEVTVDYLLGAERSARPLLRHEAVIYDGAEDFVARAAPLLAAALDAGEPALVVTSRANRSALSRHLGTAAKAVRFEDSRQVCRSPATVFDGYRGFVERGLGDGAAWLNILGEPAWDDVTPCVRYEAELNLSFAQFPLTLACLYDERALAPEVVEIARHAHA
jgi:transcriptional regulator with XRE-family HTH domain